MDREKIMTDDWGYDRDNQWGVGIEVIQKEHYNYNYYGKFPFALPCIQINQSFGLKIVPAIGLAI